MLQYANKTITHTQLLTRNPFDNWLTKLTWLTGSGIWLVADWLNQTEQTLTELTGSWHTVSDSVAVQYLTIFLKITSEF